MWIPIKTGKLSKAFPAIFHLHIVVCKVTTVQHCCCYFHISSILLYDYQTNKHAYKPIHYVEYWLHLFFLIGVFRQSIALLYFGTPLSYASIARVLHAYIGAVLFALCLQVLL